MKTNPNHNIWLVFGLLTGFVIGFELARERAEDACENWAIIVNGYTCGRFD